MQITVNGRSFTCHSDAECVWIAKVDPAQLTVFEIAEDEFAVMPFKKCPACAKEYLWKTDPNKALDKAA